MHIPFMYTSCSSCRYFRNFHHLAFHWKAKKKNIWTIEIFRFSVCRIFQSDCQFIQIQHSTYCILYSSIFVYWWRFYPKNPKKKKEKTKTKNDRQISNIPVLTFDIFWLWQYHQKLIKKSGRRVYSHFVVRI